MTNNWTRTVDRLREENRDLNKELLAAAMEREKVKPGRAFVAVLVTSIFWWSMFGVYWMVNRDTSIAAVQPKPLTMMEKAVCDRMKPEWGSSLVTTESGAYWTRKDGGKTICVRR